MMSDPTQQLEISELQPPRVSLKPAALLLESTMRRVLAALAANTQK